MIDQSAIVNFHAIVTNKQPNCILQHVLKTCAICVYMSIPIFSKHSGITYMNQSNISANLTIGN